LVRLSARYGRPLSPAETLVDIHLTHQEIADMIGTSRQSASTAINALKRQGLLCMKKHCIHIQNGRLLENLVSNLLPGAALASGASRLSFARQI
jgi:CRP/FNR family transcriptional regulator